MKNLMLSLVTILVLTGCSELQIIGNAAMNEIHADAVNVEARTYTTKEGVKPPKSGKEKTMVARADNSRHALVAKNWEKGGWER